MPDQILNTQITFPSFKTEGHHPILMTKRSHYFALLSFLFLVACTNTPNPSQSASATSNTESATKSSVPDPNDLLNTLQGRWQSEQDSTYILEIADTQMRHFNAGKLTFQSMVDIDGACKSPVCKPDGVDTSDGWCFTELKIEDGKYYADCNFVTLCNPQQLQYRLLGSAGAGLSFKKIP